MRLFGTVTGTTDRFDRAEWLTPVFDLAFGLPAPESEAPVMTVQRFDAERVHFSLIRRLDTEEVWVSDTPRFDTDKVHTVATRRFSAKEVYATSTPLRATRKVYISGSESQ